MNPLQQHLEDVVLKTWNFAGRAKNKRDEITNALLGLGGEVGEVEDLHKKMWFHSKKDGRMEELVAELGDVCYYLVILMHLHDISLEECLENNKAKLMARYPEHFEGEDASWGV